MRGFSGHFPPSQLLYLWDLVLAYDSMEVFPLLAASILSFRKDNLLRVNNITGVEAVLADSAVVAGAGGAVVNVALAVGPGEPVDTCALIAVDTINTNTIISAGITGALVNINLTVLACVT